MTTSIKNIGLLYSIIVSVSDEVKKYPGVTTILLTFPSKSADKNSKLFFSTRINLTTMTQDLCSFGKNFIQLVLDKSHRDKNPLQYPHIKWEIDSETSIQVTALFAWGSFCICSNANDLYSISFSHEYTLTIPKLFPVNITSSFAVIL